MKEGVLSEYYSRGLRGLSKTSLLFYGNMWLVTGKKCNFQIGAFDSFFVVCYTRKSEWEIRQTK